MNERPVNIASYEQFLAEGKLMATRRTQCGTLWCPPRPVCSNCKSDQMKWQEMNGKGKLATYTTIGVGTMIMLEAGYDKNRPYCSGIVELEEGPSVSAQILGVDAAIPESIKIGTPLQLDFVERGTFAFQPELREAKKTYLAFRPVG